MVFDFEATLLKSSAPDSLFPYFMIVAFEAGGLLRALFLLLSYPLVCLVGKELGLKIMVFVSFFGIRKDRLRIGTAILPKFFLEDVGYEGFDLVMRCDKKIGVSCLPKIMVEGFLKEYIGVEDAVGRDLKVAYGFFVGLIEEKEEAGFTCLKELLAEKNSVGIIGCCSSNLLYQQVFQHCKAVYSLDETEKRNWKILPREAYPKPLIFHDSRLVFRPTAFAAISMFMWLPFGLCLSIIRMAVGIALPSNLSCLILALTGTITIISKPKHTTFTSTTKNRGVLYVCNHRTLLDPVYISLSLMKPLSAVTYSMSRFNEIISPIRTVRLTRDRERDRKIVEKMLSQGDLVVCPEGTTCREPYLLRFSPLFAEVTDEIVPVAINMQTSMFYGSTATGLKCLDPIFHLANPSPIYFIKILEKLQDSETHMGGGRSKFEVANHVQSEIARALGFECTHLTRKDKYMALAGNDGTVNTTKNQYLLHTSNF
ncbi:hypothetical protein JCGZ_12013 [Jatropha curcas]|uniref:Phospholipid/glycerol acyltransferase domain-containing protein n=2 Tax=Jatropha curcas TaxID=180498 RepID=A0A067K943_JATCU|nr:hypothetical protein JCGZ_12013 [Jatropha curcas]